MKQAILLFLLLPLTVITSYAGIGAVVAAEKAIVAPQSANDYFQLGFNAANSGQYSVAVQNYTEAISLDRYRIYFYYHRGLSYKALGDRKHAAADFEQCVSMRPIAEAYYELGAMKYEEADMVAAKDYLEKAKELKNDISKLNFYLGVINYRINNYDSAEALLTHYIRTVKTNADAFLYLAMTKVKMHKYDEVSPMLQLAGLYNDNDWRLHLKMYDIYKEMDDKDNMLYHISMVIEMGQSKAEYYQIRSILYREKGETMRADYDLENAKSK